MKRLPGIAWATEAMIIKAIVDDNEAEILPYAAFYVRRGLLNLVYESKEKRDKAVESKLSIAGMQVEIEKPYAETGFTPSVRKWVYLFGVPIFEKSENVCEWFRAQGIETTGEMRCTKYADTNILTGRRSVMVQHPRGFEFPGYARYEPAKGEEESDKGPVVSFWWPRMAVCCRQCWKYGHIARACPTPMTKAHYTRRGERRNVWSHGPGRRIFP